MPSNNESNFYPKYAGKEISFIMYNSQNINSLIEHRKNELIDTINVSNNAWLKSKKQDGNSMEDIIARFDEDRKILRLKKWQSFLISFFNILKKFERPLYYQFIDLKYIQKKDNKEIMEQLNLDEVALKNLEIQVKWIAYRYAIKEELFKEEVLENVPV